MDIESDKTALRTKYRKLRDDFVTGMSEVSRTLAFSRIPSPLKAYLKRGVVVAGYVAQGSEANPASILAEAEKLGCRIVLPHVTHRAAPMRFLQWSEGDRLVPGPMGLLQPRKDAEAIDPDIVIAPLLAYDDRMMRLGQGAGFYDRALSILPNTVAVGLAWSVQHAPVLPSDPWDIPLKAILTEQSWTTL